MKWCSILFYDWIVWVYHILFILSTANRLVGFFYFLTVMNKTALNIYVQVFFSPEYSLEGLILKLKLQYFGHLMRRTDSLKSPWCWERLKAGGEGNDRGWDGWMASPTQQTWVWVNPRSWWWTGKPGVLQSMGSQRVGHDWATAQVFYVFNSLEYITKKWKLSDGNSV